MYLRDISCKLQHQQSNTLFSPLLKGCCGIQLVLPSPPWPLMGGGTDKTARSILENSLRFEGGAQGE